MTALVARSTMRSDEGGRLMEQTTRPSRRPKTGTIVIALVAGFVALVLLFPGSGIDRQPPECYSVFGYVVPCEAWVAWVVAAAVAGIVGFGLLLRDRRR
jgi:hypothetical protein